MPFPSSNAEQLVRRSPKIVRDRGQQDHRKPQEHRKSQDRALSGHPSAGHGPTDTRLTKAPSTRVQGEYASKKRVVSSADSARDADDTVANRAPGMKASEPTAEAAELQQGTSPSGYAQQKGLAAGELAAVEQVATTPEGQHAAGTEEPSAWDLLGLAPSRGHRNEERNLEGHSFETPKHEKHGHENNVGQTIEASFATETSGEREDTARRAEAASDVATQDLREADVSEAAPSSAAPSRMDGHRDALDDEPSQVLAANEKHPTADGHASDRKKRSKDAAQMPKDADAPRAKHPFGGIELDPRIVEALSALSFDKPTPIQAEAIPLLLQGHDVLGRARTGSGKTAAFGIPMLHKLAMGIRSDEDQDRAAKGKADRVRGLVLAPTRELALQVTAALRSFAKKLPMRIATIYGGSPYGPQLKALSSGVDIVVGTPGRVIDHLDRGTLNLASVQFLVLDEADEMLRMGFFEAVERIVADTPRDKQVALFSATMPAPIRKVAEQHLRSPVEVQVESSSLSTSHIAQHVVTVPERFKCEALVRILKTQVREATLVFVRTRAGAADVMETLMQRGISASALHGDLSQQAREQVVASLRSKQVDVVVATDVAARGIDIDHITHVVNFDFPQDPEIYVHRIGRTGRAGRAGMAITFVGPSEGRKLMWLRRTLKQDLPSLTVPSDADIAQFGRKRLAETLLGSDAEGAEGAETEAFNGSDGLKHFLGELRAKADDDTLLERLLSTIVRHQQVDLRTDLRDDAPTWAKPPRDSGGGQGRGGYGRGDDRGRRDGHRSGGRSFGRQDGGPSRWRDDERGGGRPQQGGGYAANRRGNVPGARADSGFSARDGQAHAGTQRGAPRHKPGFPKAKHDAPHGRPRHR